MDSDTSQTVALYKLIDWADKNRQKVCIGLGAIIVLAAVVAYSSYNARERETEANNDLFSLPSTIGPTAVKTPPDPAAYQKVASLHSGTSAGERAAILAAGLLFDANKYAEAQKLFDQFLTDYPDSGFKAQAIFGSASALEAQNKTSDAVTRYLEITRNHPTDPVADQTRLALARIYETQGKPEDALKLYELMAKPGAMSVWSSEAGERRDALLQRNPSLAATITPAVISTNSSLFKLP